MDKKIIVMLTALGFVPVNNAMATDHTINLNDTDPRVIAESFNINLDTIRVLQMFSRMGALRFNRVDGKVSVDPGAIPNTLIAKLHDSAEVTFDEETDTFILSEAFVNVLAANRTFYQLGTYPAMRTNEDILKSLKEKSTPILRDDLILYSRHSFIR